ncbi:MAG: hypothetical protein R3C41_22180 [Calditrichia bacterium]
MKTALSTGNRAYFGKLHNFSIRMFNLFSPTPAQSNAKPEELQAALQEKAKNPYRRVTLYRQKYVYRY